MAKEIKIGDVVKLKAGGPNMSVYQDHTANNPKLAGPQLDKNHVLCQWWNKLTNRYESDKFNLSNLEKVSSSSDE